MILHAVTASIAKIDETPTQNLMKSCDGVASGSGTFCDYYKCDAPTSPSKPNRLNTELSCLTP